MFSFTRFLSHRIAQTLVKSHCYSLVAVSPRLFSVTVSNKCAANDKTAEQIPQPKKEHIELTADEIRKQNLDRTTVIPVETSIRYLKSAAYKETYGNYLIWQQYRRNHKGLFPPLKTRKTCIRQGKISCGNPCPICRDIYLVLDYRNVDLLKQFISPQTGNVLSYSKTGLCQRRHFELLVAVEKAMDYGLLTFDVPFRNFDYSEYYSTTYVGANK